MPLPTMLSGWIPQLADILIPRIAELFRKDTREMKAAVDAEIAALGRAQSSMAAGLENQAATLASVETRLAEAQRKLEQVLERQEAAARQLSTLQQQIDAAGSFPRGLLYALFALVLMTFGVVVGLLVLHK